MSSLGKILLIVAAVGALACIAGAWLLANKYHGTYSELTQTKQTVETEKKEVAKATQAQQAAEKAQQTAEADAKQAKSDLDESKQKLDALQKTADDLTATAKTASDNLAKAKEELKHFQDALGMSPDEAKAAIQKAKDDQAAAETAKKIAEDQLQAVNKQLADIKETLNRGPDKMIPGISGKVTNVNRAWNFVVLDVGLSNGVVPKGELVVYRGNKFLGKVRVTSVEENTSVADILPNSKGDIQAGDYVLN